VDYDLTRLTQLGRRRKRLLDQLEELRKEITPEILAAHAADVEQKTIAELSHYTRDTVRQICLSPEQRQAEREKRRERTRKARQ
jgi:hypothetical protein